MARASDMEKKMSRVAVERLHGRMSLEEKRAALSRFSKGESGVVVSTTVIEVGVDVPEAGIMVVESASGFGLSQLHQLRGRVGRGARQGLCVLLDSVQNIKKGRRLEVMKNCDDGFAIAEEDLKLRGAGELAGSLQHGEVSFKAADLSCDADLLEKAREDAREAAREK
jgi:ATP-dependent DNA helicase RecG